MYNTIPCNEVIYLLCGDVIDAWGQRVSFGDSKPFDCFLKPSHETVTTTGGKQALTSYSILFNGECAIGVGDRVRIEGEVFTVLTKRVIRDFNKSVIMTKYTV